MMALQVCLMGWIAVACFVSALLWAASGNFPSAVAFAGFGLGYVGLAWVFA